MSNIKNMEELGRAVDVNEELQLYTSSREWVDYDAKYVDNLVGLIAEARIRIKPKTVTLYEFQHTFRGAPMWSETPPSISTAGTGRKIIDGVVTEEVQG